MHPRLPYILSFGLLCVLVMVGIAWPGDQPSPTPVYVRTVVPDSTLSVLEERLHALESENVRLRDEVSGLVAGQESLLELGNPLLERYPVPEEVVLCGERLPLERPDVHRRFEEEWSRFLVNQHWVIKWTRRSYDVFPYVQARLEAEGMPRDLSYVLVIESGLESRAYSSAGAGGWWQFIESTGKRYGLRRDKVVDERRDLGRATDAAIAYFRELHEEFGSWPLALSAYNAGERRVRDEMELQGESDFYDLSLPRETEAYWFKAAALKVLYENPGRYDLELPDPPLSNVVCDTLQLKVTRPELPLREVAESAGLSYREFRELNPAFRRSSIPRGTWRMVLPHDGVDGLLNGLEGVKLAERQRALDPDTTVGAVPAPAGGEGTATAPRN